MSGNDKTDVGKAVSLLREAANLLTGDRESEGNEDTASSATLGMCEAAVTNSNPAPSSNQDRMLQNFRTLFAGYRSTSPAASSFTKRSHTKSFPPGKRRRSSGQGYYKFRETWTCDFLCLADNRVVALNYPGVVHGPASYSLLNLPPQVALFLFSEMVLAWARFLRPIQQNLDMSELVNQENTSVVSD